MWFLPLSRHLTDGGSNWLSAVIQISKRLEGEPKNALWAAFTAHPSLKMAIVVDDDISPIDPIAVEYAIATRCQADRDFIIIPNVKGSSQTHQATRITYSQRRWASMRLRPYTNQRRGLRSPKSLEKKT